MAQQTAEQRKPWILCFVSKRTRDKKARGGIMLTVEAMAEDGTTLHEIQTDDMVQARKDIGVDSAHMDDLYKKHYPAGFRIDWTDPSKEPKDKAEGELQDLLLQAIKKGEAKEAKGSGEDLKKNPPEDQKPAAKKDAKPPAPKKPKVPKNAPREKETVLELDVPLLHDELEGLWARQDELDFEIEALDIELDRTKKAINGEISAKANEIAQIKRQRRSGSKKAMVECVIKYDWPKNQKATVRKDTGETIETKPIEWHERQEALDLDRGEEKGLKGPAKDKKGTGKKAKPPLSLICENPKAEIDALVDGEFQRIGWQDLKPGTVFRGTTPEGEHLWPNVGRRFKATSSAGQAGQIGWFVEVEVVNPPEPGKPAGETKPGGSGTKPGPTDPIEPRDPKKVLRLVDDVRFTTQKQDGGAWVEKPFASLLPGEVVRFVNKETGEIAGGKEFNVLEKPGINTANRLEIQIEAMEEPKQ